MRVYITHMYRNLGIDGLLGYTNLSSIIILLLLDVFLIFRNVGILLSPSHLFIALALSLAVWSFLNAATFLKDNSTRRLAYGDYLEMKKRHWFTIATLTCLPIAFLETVLTARVLVVSDFSMMLMCVLYLCSLLSLSGLFVLISRAVHIRVPRVSSPFFPSTRSGAYAAYLWRASRFSLTFLAIPFVWIFLVLPTFFDIAPEKILYVSACYIPLFSFQLSQTEQKIATIKSNRYVDVQKRDSVIAKGLLGSILFLTIIVPYIAALLVMHTVTISVLWLSVAIVYGIATCFSLSIFFTRLGEEHILSDFVTAALALIIFFPFVSLLVALYKPASLKRPLHTKENPYAHN